ncbi:hypothetical protein B0T24DRAFT_672701 [Lasiosphaeria ovina]|uniref:Uncharacterized protein n=1 Tax=Lasiosphaeria ovina TaxID=92902 RepID=A0AAE0NJK7_9PEZI|nr:hypothetical protein B0T24DRAFT_672701 [Lasiosphaeria ovina]
MDFSAPSPQSPLDPDPQGASAAALLQAAHMATVEYENRELKFQGVGHEEDHQDEVKDKPEGLVRPLTPTRGLRIGMAALFSDYDEVLCGGSPRYYPRLSDEINPLRAFGKALYRDRRTYYTRGLDFSVEALDRRPPTADEKTVEECMPLPSSSPLFEPHHRFWMLGPAPRRHMRKATNRRRHQWPKARRLRAVSKIAATAAICSGIAALPMAAAVGHPHAALDAAQHLAAGVSVAASAAIPPLRSSNFIDNGYWAMAYAAWGTAVSVLFVLELMQRATNLQRRLLGGTVLFSTLSLLGTLSQSAGSPLEGILTWAPLALTASLCLVPGLIGAAELRAAADVI